MKQDLTNKKHTKYQDFESSRWKLHNHTDTSIPILKDKIDDGRKLTFPYVKNV